MKQVWIIGNGFDFNLGLKTSYKDFIEEYYSNLLDDDSAIYGSRIEETNQKNRMK